MKWNDSNNNDMNRNFETIIMLMLQIEMMTQEELGVS